MKGIKIVDNFFNKEEFEILTNHLSKINFKSLINEEGDRYGFGHGFKENKENKWLFNKIKKNFFKNKNLISKDSAFRLRHNFKKILPHIDHFCDYAFICYLTGKELVYNGTGFYKKNGDQLQLDTYIGFRENRALFFNSNIYHTDLQALGESSPRYSLNVFYKNINQ